MRTLKSYMLAEKEGVHELLIETTQDDQSEEFSERPEISHWVFYIVLLDKGESPSATVIVEEKEHDEWFPVIDETLPTANSADRLRVDFGAPLGTFRVRVIDVTDCKVRVTVKGRM